MVVFVCSVPGACTHVLPPSVLYCHSYEARRAAETACRMTEPETAAGFAAKTRAACTGTLRTWMPALWMTVVAISRSASAVFWMYALSCSSRVTSATRLSLRAATAPCVRALAAVSAVSSSLVAAVTAASVGSGFGKDALLVIDVTIDRASAMRAGTARGSLREAIERLTLTVLAIGFAPCLRAAKESVLALRERRPGMGGRGDGFVQRQREPEDPVTSSSTVEEDPDGRGDGSRERHETRAPLARATSESDGACEGLGWGSLGRGDPSMLSSAPSTRPRSPPKPSIDACEERLGAIENSSAAGSPVRAAPPQSRGNETPSRAAHVPSHTTHARRHPTDTT